jgi:CPA1 family monovalent cation:H+ antiporter
MEHHLILYATLFFGTFLLASTALLAISKRFTSIPYTVALLVAGFLSQQLVHASGLHLEIGLSSDVIYFILLPILLFESAFGINIHQFRIQFKTISFLATFGLLISIFVVAAVLAYGIGLDWGPALLFGALISATDPIAVIALFKNLGGPKRLALVADGESMFNDATGVIAFKLVSTFVVANEAFSSDKVAASLGDFAYVFIGSMLVGALIGYITSLVFHKLRGDRIVVTMVTVAYSLLVFSGSEHFLGLSGVITVVVAAIVLGNFGKPKLKGDTIHFLAEFWENLGFFALSLVFFFATYQLDIDIFSRVTASHVAVAILAVLIARAASVYIGFLITNTTPPFKDEPNVPLSWQHILNWGGLRGVIPLVLVYTLPPEYEYYNEMVAFTFGTLLFTLLVNGLTIKYLLLALKLHLPAKEQDFIDANSRIFHIQELEDTLQTLPDGEFPKEVLSDVRKELEHEKKHLRAGIAKTEDPDETLVKGVRLQALHIEREVAHTMHEQGYINESVLMDFETELDLQQDALEYPDVFPFRGQTRGGQIDSGRSFRSVVADLKHLQKRFPFLGFIIRSQEKDLIVDRYMLLKTRLISSNDVKWYLEYAHEALKERPEVVKVIDRLAKEHDEFIKDNTEHIERLNKEYPELLAKYQKQVVYSLIGQGETHEHHH